MTLVQFSYQLDPAVCLKECKKCKHGSPLCAAKCENKSKYFECTSTCTNSNKHIDRNCKENSECTNECSKKCERLWPGINSSYF